MPDVRSIEVASVTFTNPVTGAVVGTVDLAGVMGVPAIRASGLPGAVAASRYVGGTTSGAPVSGTFAAGDYVVDQTGKFWVCTVAGTPGTWVQAGGSGSNPMTTLGDTTYGGAAGAVTRLPGDTSNSKRFLTGQSAAGVATAPAWAAIAAGDVPTLNQNTTGTAAGLSATLAIGSGGTGSATRNFAGLLTPTAPKTGNYTASPGDLVPVNTTSGSITVTLPTAPADLTVIAVKQVTQGGTNTVTVAAGGSDVFNVAGGTTTRVLTLASQAILIQYKSSSAIWYVVSDDLPLSQLDLRYLQAGNNLSDLGTRQTALDNLAGAVTASQVLAGNGTHVTLRALAAADLPAGTTSAQGALQLDGTAGDILPSPGTRAAGAVGKPADAAHVHGQPSNFAPTGLTGATAASRYAGATASGPPTTGTFATGDYVIDQSALLWICTSAGTPGTWVPSISRTLRDSYLSVSGTLGETVSRTGQLNSATQLVSGTLLLGAIFLPAGAVVGHLATCSAATGSVSPTHWWLGLYDNNLLQLAVTADQTSTAWGASSYKSVAVATIAAGASATFTTTYTGLYYVGVMMVAGTPVNLMSIIQINTTLFALTPALQGTSDTAQTTPPAFAHTATAPTVQTTGAWMAALT